MEYQKIDFSDVNISPKNKNQLIENIMNKIERLSRTNDEAQKSISLSLNNALEWLKKSTIELPELKDGEYYRLGYHVSDEGQIVYNVLIWEKYLEDIDAVKRVFMSSSSDDLDNDEDTIIVSID